MNYFLISQTEDGIYVRGPWSAERVQEWIDDHTVGIDSKWHPRFLEQVDCTGDGYLVHEEGTPVILIKGDIVVPKPKEVVTKYEL